MSDAIHTTTPDAPIRTGRFDRVPKPLVTAAPSAERVREVVRARHREAAVVSWLRSLGERPPRPR